jgi:two-component system, chemotaxis family, protein-glutamate methylesterase/glutaminase
VNPRRIIVIGASAGGFTALRRLFAALEPSFPVPLLVVLHTSSNSINLATHLSKTSSLPVLMAADGPIEPGIIYIAQPNRHLVIEPGQMCLWDGPRENRARPSIDVLFRTAAVAYRQYVIGVVLTGLLDEGTAGLFYVKRHGGITIVQDPNDAEFNSMPQNALRHVAIDHTLALEEIGPMLNRLARAMPRMSEFSPPLTGTYGAIREDDAKAATPSTYTCPECGGPLLQIADGSPTRFRCRVGHAFGLNSLTHAQSEDAEEKLWSAMQSLRAQADLEETLKKDAQAAGNHDRAKVLAGQGIECRRAADKIEKILVELLKNEDREVLE